MEIEEEPKNIINNPNTTQDISANELYSKFESWNKDITDKMNKLGKKDKKNFYRLKDMLIKFTRMPTPIEEVELVDIKLSSRFAEDDIFLEEDFIAEYLRRGECLFYNKISDTYEYARIGLNKFFDYKKQFDDNQKDKLQQKRVVGNMIKISEENKENTKFLAYLTTKVNGENFQVSYNTKYSCWVIASKNVSTALKNKEDINFYKNINNFKNYIQTEGKEEFLNEKQKKEKAKKEKKEEKKRKKQERIERRKKGKDKDDKKENEENEEEDEKEESKDNENKINIINENEKKEENKQDKNNPISNRYSYVIDFAETWFNLLQERIIDKNLLDQFKAELGDYTLIGESVGDKKHEHILVYKNRDIIFYGIVNNKKLLTECCLPLSQSFELFKKYNLTYTEIQPSEKYNSLTDLFSYINTQFDVIFDKSLQESGEGNVVYFSCEIDGNESIQNLGKLKTFEYRFFRKIREKCKGVPPPIDRDKIEYEEMKKFNQKKKKKEKKKKKDEKEENAQEEEKIKARINKNVENEIKEKTKEREKRIQNLIKKIKTESKELLNEVPKSKYNTDISLQKEYFDFAEYVLNYRAMDSTHYFDVFASFIEIMKEKFKKKEVINEQMINEIKKRFEGLIDTNKDEEENEEEGNDKEEDPKEE